MVRKATQILFLVCGIILATVGVKGFLLPNRFIDGGITGVSMLVSELSSIPLGLLISVINLPFLIAGWFYIGRVFFLKCLFAVTGLALSVHFLGLPVITSDKLLAAVFGGVFLGAGIGLSIRGGGVLDGTEILALMLSRRAGLGVGQVILCLNIFIFTSAAYLLGVESAMYSILTYVSAARTIDFLIHGIEEYYSLTIISANSEALRQRLMEDLGRGVTTLRGRGGKSEEEFDVLYCILTRLEISKVKAVIEEIDQNAFAVVAHVSDVVGGLVRPRVVQRLFG